jgi:hypothetical protein
MAVGVSEAYPTPSKSGLNKWCHGADMNKNGYVDGRDFMTLGQNWKRTDCSEANGWCNGADANTDGSVSSPDYLRLAHGYGKSGCFGS